MIFFFAFSALLFEINDKMGFVATSIYFKDKGLETMIQIFWYIYAAFLATSTIAYLIHGGYKNSIFLIDLVVSIITWTGLFGFVTHRQIFTPFVWQIVFFGALLWDILFYVFLKNSILEEEAEEADMRVMNIITTVFMLALLGPLYYALFQYAF
ncbi:hypothetical protein [Planococcus sp. YIM B11945]|uniref:hypothetical protein n=1 Tax=Planococcus sp. YIM B11945 TaxID=3435410 RepID=UPI003D7E342B